MRFRLPAWRLPAWGWTVSHEILLLVAVSILAAQAAGLVVLLTLPPRPPAPVAMELALERTRDTLRLVQSAKTLTEAAREARASSDRRLVFTVTRTPPPALDDPFARRFSLLMAERLGVAVDAVRMVETGPRPNRVAELPPPPQAAQPDGQTDGGPGGPGGPGGGPGPGGGGPGDGPADGQFQGPPPQTVNQTLDRAFGQQRPPGIFGRQGGRFRQGGPRGREFTAFPRGRRGLAVKAGAQWLEVRSPPSSSDALWLRQVGLTFALTLAALLLPALWLANRTARRIRAFAEGADRFGRNPDVPQMPEQGPYELRQAAAAFNRMQARIQRLVSDRTMMMAAVSHDLRTPLARMRFRIAELDPAVRDSIAEDVQQMDELITQMLSFTRDALPGAERRRFDLSALAQSLVDDLADEGKDVTFAGPDKLTVEANLTAVRRVLSNLLDNAVKFAGHARVTLTPDGDMALLIVEDAGPGVPAEMQEAIFEPFRRVEPSRNRKTGGVGLGLAIARNLARGHGGDIVLEPAAGRGARFIFSLPLA